MPSVPTGLSGAAAVSLVQSYSNEPQIPDNGVVLGFLNRGVEEVERRIGGIRLWRGYPTIANQTVVVLDHDVQDIVSANFSMGNANSQNTGSASPFAQGVLVYPMMQMEQAQFMDAAAGFPAVGFGPPQAYLIFQDAGMAPGQMLPAPPIPQLAIVPDTGIFLVWNVGFWNQAYWAGTEVAETVEVVNTYTDAQGETTPSLPADATLMLAQAVQNQSPPGFGDADGYNVYAGTRRRPVLQTERPGSDSARPAVHDSAAVWHGRRSASDGEHDRRAERGRVAFDAVVPGRDDWPGEYLLPRPSAALG